MRSEGRPQGAAFLAKSHPIPGPGAGLQGGHPPCPPGRPRAAPAGSMARSGRRAHASSTCLYRRGSNGAPMRMLSRSVAFCAGKKGGGSGPGRRVQGSWARRWTSVQAPKACTPALEQRSGEQTHATCNMQRAGQLHLNPRVLLRVGGAAAHRHAALQRGHLAQHGGKQGGLARAHRAHHNRQGASQHCDAAREGGDGGRRSGPITASRAAGTLVSQSARPRWHRAA